MLNALYRFIYFIALGVVFFPAITHAAGEESKLAKLNVEINKLQKQLRTTHSQQDRSAKRLREIEQKITDTHQRARHLHNENKALAEDLRQLQAQQTTLHKQREYQAKQVSQELVVAYRLSRENPLKVLLNTENPQELSRRLKYYEYIAKARGERLASYSNTLQQLDQTKQSLLRKQEAVADNQNRLETVRNALKKEQHERKDLLAQSKKTLNTGNGRLAKLQLEQNQLTKLIKTLQKNIRKLQASNKLPFHKQRGKLPWPVKGKVEKRFGASRGASLKWQGWRLSAKNAATVKAIHHGRVVFSNYLRGQGLLVILDHGDGYLSLYGHNQIALKKMGSWVTAGEAIAKVGDTGGLEHSALYFEIRHKGKAVNPKHWLKPRT